jgi:hypothetical protein
VTARREISSQDVHGKFSLCFTTNVKPKTTTTTTNEAGKKKEKNSRKRKEIHQYQISEQSKDNGRKMIL